MLLPLWPEADTSPPAPSPSAAGGAAVRQHLQAEPCGLQQFRLGQELLVWARFLLFWSPSWCMCCRMRLGWPQQPAPAGGPWQPGGKSRNGRSQSFPPGGFLGSCSWGTSWALGQDAAARLEGGGPAASGSAPVRGPQGPYLRGFRPQRGAWTLSLEARCPGVLPAALCLWSWGGQCPGQRHLRQRGARTHGRWP